MDTNERERISAEILEAVEESSREISVTLTGQQWRIVGIILDAYRPGNNSLNRYFNEVGKTAARPAILAALLAASDSQRRQ